MFAYCGNNPVKYVDKTGNFPIEILAIPTLSTTLVVVGSIVAAYCITALVFNLTDLFVDSIPQGHIIHLETEDPGPPDVTYPGDDPEKAPEGYEWRGPDPQGGKRGGYANPEGKDSWHPDLDHPEGVDSHWDYNDGIGHKWRIFPDRIELA